MAKAFTKADAEKHKALTARGCGRENGDAPRKALSTRFLGRHSGVTIFPLHFSTCGSPFFSTATIAA